MPSKEAHPETLTYPVDVLPLPTPATIGSEEKAARRKVWVGGILRDGASLLDATRASDEKTTRLRLIIMVKWLQPPAESG